MSETFLFWLGLNLSSIATLAFFSMSEMACVSLSKIRLQYYLSKGDKRAKALNYLLEDSSRLFGITLIGVNSAMTLGSECARQCLQSMGWNPDFAALPQVFLVVIFGELTPMFAARHFAEHVAMLSSRILYLFALMMNPFLIAISKLSRACDQFFLGNHPEHTFTLTQEEIQKMVEEQHEETSEEGRAKINQISERIFHLNKTELTDLMTPVELNCRNSPPCHR